MACENDAQEYRNSKGKGGEVGGEVRGEEGGEVGGEVRGEEGGEWEGCEGN